MMRGRLGEGDLNIHNQRSNNHYHVASEYDLNIQSYVNVL